MDITYTQVTDQDGTIKYVPNISPESPPGKTETPSDGEREVRERYNTFNFDNDPELTSKLRDLLANAKRLRYNKRLANGKLDGARLRAYKTSDRLFKKKAIKDRNYQFTFLLDTSGSMMHEEPDNRTKLELASDAVVRTVKSLQDIKMRSAVFSMNNAFELLKDFDTAIDDTKFVNDIVRICSGTFENDNGREINKAGGTFEWVAYEQTMKYLAKNTPSNATNVVIVLSDGAPGGKGNQCQVTIDGVTELVESDNAKDTPESLSRFWDKQYPTLAFGIGIKSKARQVPTNKRIDDITKLPSVLSNLLTELML